MLKSNKSLVALIVLLLIVAVVGWTVYYLKADTAPNLNTPPVLKLTEGPGTAFQGLVYKAGNDLAFETALKDDSFSLSAAESLVVDELSKKNAAANVSLPQNANLITAGAAYYYSQEELKVSDLFAALLSKSPKMNEVLIAYYDNGVGKYRVSPPANTDVKKIIFDKAGVGSLKDDYIIKPFYPFVVYSKIGFAGPNFVYSAQVPLDSLDFGGVLGKNAMTTIDSVMGTATPDPGWYLIPRNSYIAMDAFLAPLGERLGSYYLQKDPKSFGSECFINKPCPDGGRTYYFVWVNIVKPMDAAVKDAGKAVEQNVKVDSGAEVGAGGAVDPGAGAEVGAGGAVDLGAGEETGAGVIDTGAAGAGAAVGGGAAAGGAGAAGVNTGVNSNVKAGVNVKGN